MDNLQPKTGASKDQDKESKGKLYIPVRGEKRHEAASGIVKLKASDMKKPFSAFYAKLAKFKNKHGVVKIDTSSCPSFWNGVEKINMAATMLSYKMSEVGVQVKRGIIVPALKNCGHVVEMTRTPDQQHLGLTHLEQVWKPKSGTIKDIVESNLRRCRKKSVQELINAHYLRGLKSEKVEYPSEMEFSLLMDQQNDFSMCQLKNMVNMEGVPSVPGFNTPFFYVGINGSASSTHIEDLGLSSYNVAHRTSSEFQGCKIWICPKPRYFDDLIRLLNVEANPTNLVCRNILMKKQFHLEPEWLERHGIKYDLYFQRAGDAIVTFPRGVHGVVNVGTIFTEAINFAYPDSAITSFEWENCSCGKKCSPAANFGINITALAKSWEKSNPIECCGRIRMQTKNKRGKKTRTYDCIVCAKKFGTSQLLSQHKKRSHKPGGRKFSCEVCGRAFVTNYVKDRHVAAVHKNKFKNNDVQ